MIMHIALGFWFNIRIITIYLKKPQSTLLNLSGQDKVNYHAEGGVVRQKALVNTSKGLHPIHIPI